MAFYHFSGRGPGYLIFRPGSTDTPLVATFATELVFWFVLPALVALGAAYLVWLLMQARIQVLAAHYEAAVSKVENDSSGRRPAVDELLAELRMERRRFVRRTPTPNGFEATVILQERLYLRNIPLTSWMQEELPLGHGEELPAETTSVPLIEPGPVQSVTVPFPAA